MKRQEILDRIEANKESLRHETRPCEIGSIWRDQHRLAQKLVNMVKQ